MNWEHVIKNGSVYLDGRFVDANIYIKNGKIAAISDQNLGDSDISTDATGLFVLPGLFDTHVHSRDPHATHKEDFYHSTMSAAIGGVTCIFEMPNSVPSISNVENLEFQIKNLSSKANVNFGIWGGAYGDLNKNQILPLSQAGVIAFKFFWGYAINQKDLSLVYNYTAGMPDVIPPLDDGEVLDIFKAVQPTGQCLAIHAENIELIVRLSEQVRAQGRSDYQALLDTRPSLVEAATVGLAIQYAKYTGTHLHVLHVTSKGAVDLIRNAQKEGIRVTGETCPHYLFLTNKDFERLGNMMKVYPPIKYQEDQDALWEAIADGTLSIVCSDHAPHTPDEKKGDLFKAPAGGCGVETLVPMLLNAVNEGRLSLLQAVALLAENPAKQFGLFPQKGTIAIGADADLTIVDMQKEAELRAENLHSVSKVMPFDGFKVKGMPVMTVVGGHIVAKDGKLVNDKKGLFVKPIKLS